jgi:PhnB protein
MAVESIPEGYRTATPYLIIDGASAAIDFYRKVFGAVERMRMPDDKGGVGHAELEIGDSVIMLADEQPMLGYRGPKSIGGTPVSIMLYVEDVDARVKLAVSAGATVKQEVETKFYGDRSGSIEDPFGHVWTISTHVEDVSPEEMAKRAQAMAKA